MKILIVEDEISLAESIKFALETFGYTVDSIADGDVALRRILVSHKEYDLIILDWMLPNKDGLEICKKVRADKINLPILMLTARFDLKDKVEALDAGADDYLVKPFSSDELQARIRALLRRPTELNAPVLEAGVIKLDPNTRKVMLGEKNVRLTTKEFSLLEYLLRHKDKVVSRGQILDHLWSFDFNSFSNVIDVHMKNLRRKLRYKSKSAIETIRGVGYRIKSRLW